MLNKIDRGNLFVVPLDHRQHWFRYHSLFAEALAAHLELTNPAALPGLHRKACAWLLEHGYTDRAVEHALAAKDMAKAAEIVEGCAMQAMATLDLSCLVRWIGCFSEELIQLHPRLGIYYALANFHLGRLDLVEPKLQVVEQVLKTTGEGGIPNSERRLLSWEIAATRAMMDCMRGSPSHEIARSQELIANAPEKDSFIYGSLIHWVAIAYNATGNLDAAVASFKRANQFAFSHRLRPAFVHSGCEIARIRKKQGRLCEAEGEYQKALDYARQYDLDVSIGALAQTGLIEIAVERNDLKAATLLASDLEEYLARMEANTLLYLYPVVLSLRLAKYYLALRNIDRTQFYLQKAVKTLHDYRYQFKSDPTDLIDLQARLATVTGELTPLDHWPRGNMGRLSFNGEPALAEQVARAKVLLARHKSARALSLLKDLESVIRKADMGERLMENFALQALAYRENGQGEEAFRLIGQALEMAQAEGYVRVFVDEGESMKALLEEYRSAPSEPAADQTRRGDYLETIMAAFARTPKLLLHPAPGVKTTTVSPVSELFSDRETQVLGLLVAGKTLKEIAATLMISINTTKTHVKSIYRKLGAHNRKQILQRAAELDIQPQTG